MHFTATAALLLCSLINIVAAHVPVKQMYPQCTYPAWESTKVYNTGDSVTHIQLAEYKARWWTQGEEPGTTGPHGVWEYIRPCSGTPTQPPKESETPSPTPPGALAGAYFPNWVSYDRNYFVKNIDTSGAAANLTHIFYAFGDVDTSGKCKIMDAWADYQRPITAAQSVDGVADSATDPLKGNFNQLLKLKRKYPHIKVMYSIGGWTHSVNFGIASQNPEEFAQSCHDMVFDQRWEGVFDGIDIDWEYPNTCGLVCDDSGYDSFRILMKAIREKFQTSLVSAAISGSANGQLIHADYAGAIEYMNFVLVMAYDYFSPGWLPSGPTAPHAPLVPYPGIPDESRCAEVAINFLLDRAVPADKIILGLPFYGRGWQGVTQSYPGGSATGPATGAYEPGVEDYKVLIDRCPTTGNIAGTTYAFCSGEWWGYDTPSSITTKVAYAASKGLGGTFAWELSGDSTSADMVHAMTEASTGMKLSSRVPGIKKNLKCDCNCPA